MSGESEMRIRRSSQKQPSQSRAALWHVPGISSILTCVFTRSALQQSAEEQLFAGCQSLSDSPGVSARTVV